MQKVPDVLLEQKIKERKEFQEVKGKRIHEEFVQKALVVISSFDHLRRGVSVIIWDVPLSGEMLCVEKVTVSSFLHTFPSCSF